MVCPSSHARSSAIHRQIAIIISASLKSGIIRFEDPEASPERQRAADPAMTVKVAN
jgi:hypothetical protein